MAAVKTGQRLEPAVFNQPGATWMDEREADGSGSGELLPSSGITVVTWNIWFAAYYFQLRLNAMLQTVRACDPDVICLQEVTPDSLAIILEQPWIRAHYRISDAFGDTVDPYGVLLLSRLPIRMLQRFPLPTEMGRSLLTAEVATGAGPLTIGTVHLESLDNPERRQEQLEIIFPLLKCLGHPSMLVGDFNLCSSWKVENDRLDPEFIDLWPALRGSEPGYSEDTDVNLMLLNVKRRPRQVRFDRILLRSTGGSDGGSTGGPEGRPGGGSTGGANGGSEGGATGGLWRPESIERLGTTPVVPSMPDVFPSDHFGLVARLQATPPSP